MPRIAGVDIPERKKIFYSLQYIHGIGNKFAGDILEEAGINPETKASDLSETEVSTLNSIVDSAYLVEGALRRQVQQNISRLREIRSYRGDRHRARAEREALSLDRPLHLEHAVARLGGAAGLADHDDQGVLQSADAQQGRVDALRVGVVEHGQRHRRRRRLRRTTRRSV